MEATAADATPLVPREKAVTNGKSAGISTSGSCESLSQSDRTESGEESDLELSGDDSGTGNNRENDEHDMEKGGDADEELEEQSGISNVGDARLIDNQQGSEDGRSSDHSLDLSVGEPPLETEEEESLGLSHESSMSSDCEFQALVLLSDEDLDSVELQCPNTEKVEEDQVSLQSVSSLELTDDARASGEHGDDDDDHDALWAAFDTSLQAYAHATERTGAFQEVTNPPIDHEDAYDGSESDNSASDNPEDIEDCDVPTGMKDERVDAEYTRMLRHDHRIDTLHCESLSLPNDSDSSVSSLMSSAGSHHEQHEVVSISSSLDNEDAGDSGRWIENIPQLQAEPPRYDSNTLLQNGGEVPLIWLPNQYVAPKTRSRRKEEPPAVTHRTPDDCESIKVITDNPQSELHVPRLAAHLPERPGRTLQVHDWYVSYADIAAVIERHVPYRGGVCVDLGCGTSRLCEELVFHGYHSVWGVDCERDVIEFQRSRVDNQELRNYVHYLQVNAEEALRFVDNSCELVISKATLDEIASRCAHEAYPRALVDTLKGVIRCLKPGGTLIAVSYQAHWLHVDERAYCSEDMSAWAPAECRAFREMMPWWLWTEVNGLIERELDPCGSYDLGKPQLADGIIVKPYLVRVWRRKESARERVQHLRAMRLEEMWGQLDLQSRMQQQRQRRYLEEEENRNVLESRLMILEDERVRLVQREKYDKEASKLRASQRAAYWTAVLEEDRRLMVMEDSASTQWRSRELKICVVAEVLDLIIRRAVEAAEATRESKRVASMQAVARQREVVPPLQLGVMARMNPVVSNPSTKDWLQGLITQVIDEALSRASRSEHSPPAPTHEERYMKEISSGELDQLDAVVVEDSSKIAQFVIETLISKAVSRAHHQTTEAVPVTTKPSQELSSLSPRTVVPLTNEESDPSNPSAAPATEEPEDTNVSSPTLPTAPTFSRSAGTTRATAVPTQQEQHPTTLSVRPSDALILTTCQEAIDAMLTQLTLSIY